MIGYFLIVSSLIALGFLIYTLFHLKQLNISYTHPRVIVELLLFIIFMISGIFFILKR